MLDIEHNPDALFAYSRVWVKNLGLAKALVRKIMDDKRPRGLRIRHSYDYMSNSIYLEARTSSALHTLETELKHAGYVSRITQERVQSQ